MEQIEKIMEFNVGNRTYCITGTFDPDEPNHGSSDVFYSLEMTENNKPVKRVPCSWSGPIDVNQLLNSAIASYFNDDISIKFAFIHNHIKDYKEKMQSYEYEINGRRIPNFILDPYSQIYKLVAITKYKKDNTGNAYYVSYDIDTDFFDDDYIIATATTDGTVKADITDFVRTSLNQAIEDFNNNECDFIYADEHIDLHPEY